MSSLAVFGKAITAILIAGFLLYALGMFVQNRIAKKNPDHHAVKQMSRGELLMGICITVLLLVGATIYELSPDNSAIVTWFSNWYAWPVLFLSTYVVGAVLALFRLIFQHAKN